MALVTKLDKTMPDISMMKQIAAGIHADYFHAFENTDVWTHDGYLVTAILNHDIHRNLVRAEIRRDIFQQVVLRNASDAWYYVPNAQTEHYGF